MPKQPRLRANYHADGQYLLRLVHAIEADPNRPPDWKRDTIDLVSHLAHRFLEAYGETPQAPDEAPETIRKTRKKKKGPEPEETTPEE